MNANSQTIVNVADGILTVNSTEKDPATIYFLLGLGQKELLAPAVSLPASDVPRLASPSPVEAQAILNGK